MARCFSAPRRALVRLLGLFVLFEMPCDERESGRVREREREREREIEREREQERERESERARERERASTTNLTTFPPRLGILQSGLQTQEDGAVLLCSPKIFDE